jgi:DNA-binding NarL/FixJ family response regulator
LIKIILAEDHQIVRDGIRGILDQEPDMQVIYEAVNGQDVLDYLKDGEQPDLILTDMNMPELDGMAMLRELQMTYPVLVLSMLDNENYVLDTLQAGARGYLLKNVNKKEMVLAIRYIADGGTYICTEIALKTLKSLARLKEIPSYKIELNIEFSEREMEVLKLIAEGFTNKEMASKLFSSRRTIEGHRLSLMEKTGSKNTATLIKFSVQNGLVE